MGPEKLHHLIAFFLIGTGLPFGTWGLLLIIAKLRHPDLRPMIRWLRLARWAVWLVGITLATAALVTNRMWHSWHFSIGMSLVALSLGLTFPEKWVKRNYAPELIESESGQDWRPTARS